MSANLLYLEVYNYYRQLIEKGSLSKGDKLPSLRACCIDRDVSKTTAETAYFQIIADGYIISRERSGYYVSNNCKATTPIEKSSTVAFTYEHASYDLSTVGEDPNAFCFDLWQRYMKSAMRDTSRLISYGEPQGEIELRNELSNYVRKRRNIYCSMDNIVVGASTQTLLILLLSILKRQGMTTASVPTIGFKRYAQVFSDNDFTVGIRNKEADVIYVSPAHMTEWGDVMPITRRYEILEHSKNGHLIIEDDYLNELNYSKMACPSIYALSGGDNVVYLGSFSRVLLPSIRISFMILPDRLMDAYLSVKDLYDQTASKTEQLALCQFLRDDQLYRHIRKVKRLYGTKREVLFLLLNSIKARFEESDMLFGESGTEAGLRIKKANKPALLSWLIDHKIKCKVVDESWDYSIFLFSCGIIPLKTLDNIIDDIS